MLRLPFRLLANFFRLLGFLWSSFWFGLGKHFRRRRSVYLKLELESSYPIGEANRGGLRRWLSSPSTSMLELRDSIKQLIAIDNDEIEGVIVHVKGLTMGPARVSELAQLFDELRESGKRVVMHTDSANTREMPLLASADDILLTPAGRVYLFGYRFEEIFVAELLDKLGVQGQFIHLGAFKTATHRMHKTGMTPAQRLMMQSLHDGLMSSLISRISARRGLTEAQVRHALSESPLGGVEAEQLGLISDRAFKNRVERWLQQDKDAKLLPEDSPLYKHAWSADSIEAHRLLGKDLAETDREEDEESGEEAEDEEQLSKEDARALKRARKERSKTRVQVLPMEAYLAARPELSLKPLFGKKRYMAILDLSGAIVMDGEGGASPLGGGVTINPEEVNPALTRLSLDPRCLGILLHINSPGGSALASDLMWQQIQRARQLKPVVCWISDIGASGGYYLAAAGDRIVCREDTITGSIGVITGKVAVGSVLGKFHVRTEAIYDDDSALFTSTFEPLPPRVMQNFRDDARAFYRRFLERVGQARALDRRRMHRYARGRVYTGRDALDRGLVDDLGGLEAAQKILYELCETTPKKAPFEYIEHRKQSLRSVVSGSLIQASPTQQRIEGFAKHTLAPLEVAAWLEREPLLALLPWQLDNLTRE